MTLIWVSFVVVFVVVIAVTLLVGRRSTAFRDNQALRDAAEQVRRSHRSADDPDGASRQM